MAEDGPRVLIIENDAGEARRVRRLLSCAGGSARAECVGSLSEAAACLRESAADAVLLDLELPGGSGLEALRAQFGDVPVLVLADGADEELAARSLRAGAQDYLVRDELSGPSLLRAVRHAVERHARERELRAERRYHRSLLHSLHEDILVTGQDRRICDVNNTFLHTTGHRREDVVGRQCREVMHGHGEPCASAGVDCPIEHVFETGHTAACEHRHVRADGAEAVVSMLLSPLRDADGRVTHVIQCMRDETELATARTALADSERRLSGIVHNSADGIVIVDAEGKVVFVNPAAEALLVRDGQALLGSMFGFPVESGRIADIEIRRPDGQTRTAEMSISRTNWAGAEASLILLRDITSRKEAERELEGERRFSNAIVETAGALICVISPEGRIVRFNRACQKATGYTLAEVSHKAVWEVLVPDDEAQQVRDVFESLKEGSEFLNYENHWLTKGGERRLISWANTRVLDECGEARWIIATGIDVTEQRQLEEHLRRAARLEAVGQLAGGIAHDFNNLLTAIMGYIGLNLPEVPEETRLADDLRLAMTAAKRASDLTRQLLTFSRNQPPQIERIDLNVSVSDACKMLRHLIEENIEMRVVLTDQPLTVKGDPAQIGQVIMNLAVNARDAMPDGGVLSVETALIGPSDEITSFVIEGEEEDDDEAEEFAALIVRDTGLGMEADVRERVFDPFFTTKPLGHGTGLGLSTVYGIVRQHRGTVECDSEPGRGSVFTVRLPLAREGETTTAEESGSQFEFGHSETILIVEDEDEVRELASRALSHHGYRILQATNGPEALDVLDEHSGPLDLLITDVVMPRMDGRELAQHVRLSRPETRILFISGYARDAVGEAIGRQLATRLLQKPFSMRSLTRRVREVLDAS